MILKELKQYKAAAILSPLFVGLEVLMEVLLPFVTALIIDQGLQQQDLSAVWHYGIIMVVMAFLSLIFGALSGAFAARASSGLAANLRNAIYKKVQTFSFSDKGAWLFRHCIGKSMIQRQPGYHTRG